MPRPSAEQRRRDYLDIGATIVAEFDATSDGAAVDALANVRVAEVAERAGVTKGALYHVWPTQEAYRKDLFERLLEHSRQAGIRDLGELLSDEDLTRDPRRALHEHAEYVFRALKDDPAFFARFSFFLYASDPEVNELLTRGDDAVIAEFTPLIEAYLELQGRRIRPPFTVEMLLISMNALFHGLCLRYRTSPDLVDKPALDEPNGPNMYAFGIEALAQHFSEPVSARNGGT
jgi:AcrR family transcriptional regulator